MRPYQRTSPEDAQLCDRRATIAVAAALVAAAGNRRHHGGVCGSMATAGATDARATGSKTAAGTRSRMRPRPRYSAAGRRPRRRSRGARYRPERASQSLRLRQGGRRRPASGSDCRTTRSRAARFPLPLQNRRLLLLLLLRLHSSFFGGCYGSPKHPRLPRPAQPTASTTRHKQGASGVASVERMAPLQRHDYSRLARCELAHSPAAPTVHTPRSRKLRRGRDGRRPR